MRLSFSKQIFFVYKHAIGDLPFFFSFAFEREVGSKFSENHLVGVGFDRRVLVIGSMYELRLCSFSMTKLSVF